ncbi:hypothetical protein HMPREF9946_01308 [Acetobacteraceae bacterium AT-5844]|nr:hypothetical protein HMPREF9946_01308 [Acetobacteraceae bacterium AT-5844]
MPGGVVQATLPGHIAARRHAAEQATPGYRPGTVSRSGELLRPVAGNLPHQSRLLPGA